MPTTMQATALDPSTGERPGTVAKPSDLPDEEKVLSEFNSRRKNARAHWSDWRNEARDLYDLVAGRQWSAEDEAKLKEQLRPMVTFNVAGKYMDAVTGLQINNRQDIRYFPREEGDAKSNELMTGAVSWSRDLCDQADEETDAFYDAVLTGLGWMEGYLDKDLEPGGVPAGQRVDNMEMYPDPSARKRNLVDAEFVIREKLMNHDEYMELAGEEYGEAASDDDSARSDADDAGLQVIEQNQDYDDNSSDNTQRTKAGKCPVSDYQFWRREERYRIEHPQFGQKELTEQELAPMLPVIEEARAAGKPINVTTIRKKVFYRAFIAKGRILQFGLSPYQEGFTYHAITGKRDRNRNTWYGIGRSIVDPQRWLNKFFSTILYVLMTNAKGGILAEENTFKDARKAESEWANPESITWLKDGALQKGKIEPKPPANYPQGLDRLMEFTLQSLPQTTGLNVELMGLADRVQAGVVEAQRKQSAMAIIAWAFDAMRRYYRSMGRQLARYVIDYVPEGTLVMVNGMDSKQYVPLLKNRVAMTFDIIVDEAPTSVNMKERVWMALETLIPSLLQAGIKIPKAVLDYSPLPSDLVQQWKKEMEPDPKAQQFQEQSAQADLKKTQTESMKNETQAQLNLAKAAEASSGGDLKSMQAVKTAAEAGAAQAGGQPKMNS